MGTTDKAVNAGESLTQEGGADKAENKNKKALWGFQLGEGIGNGESAAYEFTAKVSLYDDINSQLGLTSLDTKEELEAWGKKKAVKLSQAELIAMGALVSFKVEWVKGKRKGYANIVIPADKVSDVLVKKTIAGKEFGNGRIITLVRGRKNVTVSI